MLAGALAPAVTLAPSRTSRPSASGADASAAAASSNSAEKDAWKSALTAASSKLAVKLSGGSSSEEAAAADGAAASGAAACDGSWALKLRSTEPSEVPASSTRTSGVGAAASAGGSSKADANALSSAKPSPKSAFHEACFCGGGGGAAAAAAAAAASLSPLARRRCTAVRILEAGGRCAGSGVSIARITLCMSSVYGEAGGMVYEALRICSTLSEANGCSWKQSRKRMQPSAHTSTSSLTSWLRYRSAISGARYVSVEYFAMRSSSSISSLRLRSTGSRFVVALPKSHSTNCWLSVASTFSSFRSRWATGGSCACMSTTPHTMDSKTSSTRACDSGARRSNSPFLPFLYSRSISEPCEQNSSSIQYSRWPLVPGSSLPHDPK